ncbi:hypothetical protein SLE2022_379610 [Rubroshorea leprosula]
MLPSLEDLYLPNCNLHYLPPFVPIVNFSSIWVIDLSSMISSHHYLASCSILVPLLSLICQSGIKDSLDNVDDWENLCILQFLALHGNEITREIVKLVDSLSKCNNYSLEVLELATN